MKETANRAGGAATAQPTGSHRRGQTPAADSSLSPPASQELEQHTTSDVEGVCQATERQHSASPIHRRRQGRERRAGAERATRSDEPKPQPTGCWGAASEGRCKAPDASGGASRSAQRATGRSGGARQPLASGSSASADSSLERERRSTRREHQREAQSAQEGAAQRMRGRAHASARARTGGSGTGEPSGESQPPPNAGPMRQPALWPHPKSPGGQARNRHGRPEHVADASARRGHPRVPRVPIVAMSHPTTARCGGGAMARLVTAPIYAEAQLDGTTL